MNDIYSVYSPRLHDIMQAYIQQYHPTYRLKEGSSGGQYAERSVQSVLRRAIQYSEFGVATIEGLSKTGKVRVMKKTLSLEFAPPHIRPFSHIFKQSP